MLPVRAHGPGDRAQQVRVADVPHHLVVRADGAQLEVDREPRGAHVVVHAREASDRGPPRRDRRLRALRIECHHQLLGVLVVVVLQHPQEAGRAHRQPPAVRDRLVGDHGRLLVLQRGHEGRIPALLLVVLGQGGGGGGRRHEQGRAGEQLSSRRTHGAGGGPFTNAAGTCGRPSSPSATAACSDSVTRIAAAVARAASVAILPIASEYAAIAVVSTSRANESASRSLRSRGKPDAYSARGRGGDGLLPSARIAAPIATACRRSWERKRRAEASAPPRSFTAISVYAAIELFSWSRSASSITASLSACAVLTVTTELDFEPPPQELRTAAAPPAHDATSSSRRECIALILWSSRRRIGTLSWLTRANRCRTSAAATR